MNRSSFFIQNKALFGSYPSENGLKELEENNVRYFIDLTCVGEKGIIKYTTPHTYINYPIKDCRCPSDWKSFAQLVIRVSRIINNLQFGRKVYVHCRGGHGRSGILVACILCYLYKMQPTDAIINTSKFHHRRLEMREKWRKLGSPQTRSQKTFVTKFFEPLYIYNTYSRYFSAVFSNNAKISVTIPGVDTFSTANIAFNVMKRIEHESKESKESKESWDDVKDNVMLNVLTHKFDQNSEINASLQNTGLRTIVVCSVDPYWGKRNDHGRNVLGKLLTKVRENLYMATV